MTGGNISSASRAKTKSRNSYVAGYGTPRDHHDSSKGQTASARPSRAAAGSRRKAQSSGVLSHPFWKAIFALAVSLFCIGLVLELSDVRVVTRGNKNRKLAPQHTSIPTTKPVPSIPSSVYAPTPKDNQAKTEGESLQQQQQQQHGVGSDIREETPKTATPDESMTSATKLYTYRIVNEYEHDHQAFTQGLLYSQKCSRGSNEKEEEEKEECKDTLLESTGLNGHTSVRRVDLQSGAPISKTNVAYKHFGEGCTTWGDELFQLTWKSPTTLVYNLTSLEKIDERKTDLKDGWGLTNDDAFLIATDSGYTLYFLDPKTLKTSHKVDVHDGEKKVHQLNELEYVEGEVWANIWLKDCIARIDPVTGRVKGWIIAEDLTMRERQKNHNLGRLHNMDVLNGIAYDPATKRVWLTGKKWSTIYEVEIIELENTDPAMTQSKCIAGASFV